MMAASTARVKKLIFLGTGTSDGVPNLGCLARDACSVCDSSMTDAGRKNKRCNISVLVQFHTGDDNNDSRLRNVLIDCGKRFHESARLFRHYGISELDGIIITHGHADACGGLDDLRQFQDGITIYLSDEAMSTVGTMFDYLVKPGQTTRYDSSTESEPSCPPAQPQMHQSKGNSVIANVHFKIIDSHKPFSIGGLSFLPLPVRHGESTVTERDGDTIKQKKVPYFCLGFHFDGISYFSDTDLIPEDAFQRVKDNTRILVVDALRWRNLHSSHFSVEEALQTTIRLKPLKSYYAGFTHRVDHYEAERYLKNLEDGELDEDFKDLRKSEQKENKEPRLPIFEDFAAMKGLKAAPAYDGLCVDLENIASESPSITETDLVIHGDGRVEKIETVIKLSKR